MSQAWRKQIANEVVEHYHRDRLKELEAIRLAELRREKMREAKALEQPTDEFCTSGAGWEQLEEEDNDGG